MSGSQTELLDTLLKLGYISPDSLKALKALGQRKAVPPVEATLLSGILHADARSFLLADALGLPFQDVDPGAVPLALGEVIPEEVARENLLAPLSREENRLTLAVADPFRHPVFSAIEERTGLELRLVVCPARTIGRILDRLYPDANALSSEEVTGGLIAREEAQAWLVQGRARRLAERMLLYAAQEGMTSVRLFPVGRTVCLSGVKAGESSLLLSFPLRFRGAMLAALADVAGHSPPSGGVSESTFHLDGAAGVLCFRAAFLRGLSGPEAVVRVLPDLTSTVTLDSVGLNPDQADVVRRLLGRRDGFFLLASPGPEGAPTTMFAMLREMVRPGLRVVTVEETFRFRTERYIQLERRDVESRYAGRWTRLAESLDPDALMVEQVERPSDLLELIHLARKGIPVVCGVRSVSFEETLRSLLTLDGDPFTLARVVRLVLHQRLVDLLCPACRRPVPAKPSARPGGSRRREELEALVQDTSFYVPAGCALCSGKGYSGRMALVEMLPFTHGVQNAVLSDGPLEERLGRLAEENLYPAFHAVKDLLQRGLVTFDDALPFLR